MLPGVRSARVKTMVKMIWNYGDKYPQFDFAGIFSLAGYSVVEGNRLRRSGTR
jgi:hypothetical protein